MLMFYISFYLYWVRNGINDIIVFYSLIMLLVFVFWLIFEVEAGYGLYAVFNISNKIYFCILK